MKVIINNKNILTCLKNITYLVNNNINHILKCVYIEACENSLILSGSNGTCSYQQKIIDVEVVKQGSILVNANLLYNLISKINNSSIEIEQIDDSILQIKAKNFSCTINLFDSNSFPSLSFSYENLEKLTITKKDLDLIKEKILPFTSKEFINQYSVNGILFNPINENKLECVATDSFRIAYHKIDYSGIEKKFIISSDTINLLSIISADLNCQNIDFYFAANNNCICKINNTLISFTLCENNFPNIISKVLEKQNYKFELNCQDLFKALDCGSSIVFNETKPMVFLKIVNKKLLIDFVSSGIGHSTNEIDILENSIDKFESKLNLKFLFEIIKKIDSSIVCFSFNKKNSSLIITPKKQDFIFLILPIFV